MKCRFVEYFQGFLFPRGFYLYYSRGQHPWLHGTVSESSPGQYRRHPWSPTLGSGSQVLFRVSVVSPQVSLQVHSVHGDHTPSSKSVGRRKQNLGYVYNLVGLFVWEKRVWDNICARECVWMHVRVRVRMCVSENVRTNKCESVFENEYVWECMSVYCSVWGRNIRRLCVRMNGPLNVLILVRARNAEVMKKSTPLIETW